MTERTVAALALTMAWAGAAMAADDLPKAETILDKYIEVTGGKAAYQKIHSEIETGSMTINGISGTSTTYKAEPDLTEADIVFQGFGTMKQGSNGKVAWSLNSMQGPRVLEGEEKDVTLLMDRFDADVNWRGTFPKAETVGAENVNGKDCYKVVLTPKAGKPMTRYYDKQTGLLVKSIMTATTAMGELTIESSFDDYRKEGDILRPHKITNSSMGMQFSVSIDKVEYNAEIPKSRFDLPAEIQALVNKDKK